MVALHSKGTRDRLRSFEGRIGHSIRVGHCGENAFSSPVAPYLLISLDEGCLLLRVQLARHRLRLAMLHAKAMQQCDQARPALVCDAALPFDPGANLARRSRQGFADPGLQFVLLLVRQPAGAALVAEARQALDPIFLIQPEPGPDRVVVDQQHSGDRLAAHPVVQQHQCIGTARQTMGGRSVAGQLDQVLPRFAVKEAGPYPAVLNAIESRLRGYGLGKVSPECHSLRWNGLQPHDEGFPRIGMSDSVPACVCSMPCWLHCEAVWTSFPTSVVDCCVKKTRKRHAVREMKEDPSKPLCRGRLQTAMSGCGQNPWS